MKDHITIVGNVGGDPEFRRLPDGTPVVSLRVASTDRRYDAKTGAWVDGHTSWYRVSVFRTLGEHVAASVRRGQRVVVHGVLAIKRWEAGEKTGTDAEIDALAVGHDLAFGTTVFTGAARSRDETPAVDTEAEWAAPGAGAESVDEPQWQAEPVATPF
ncbi:single-stranded DNA-binding protein [Microbacterium oleivorans]|uniref:Single-stranded DNA-binding protein n=1 Tax=Microbacterium oleivorans TaxID=273677 RepID=A0A031FZ27_9MICO|nr:single-stranded DNA-binding protein [Microbacterium oleivorans]AZS43908.1 Single-stranded DNA-binding protein 1 [Microbacterium oleivorans]EZP29823.1 Single-stranded DNA-binding protein [Microbacterium oleivorans]THE07270.1 single-stranded DNA-binding protein [Microbacterium oleivorans]